MIVSILILKILESVRRIILYYVADFRAFLPTESVRRNLGENSRGLILEMRFWHDIVIVPWSMRLITLIWIWRLDLDLDLERRTTLPAQTQGRLAGSTSSEAAQVHVGDPAPNPIDLEDPGLENSSGIEFCDDYCAAPCSALNGDARQECGACGTVSMRHPVASDFPLSGTFTFSQRRTAARNGSAIGRLRCGCGRWGDARVIVAERHVEHETARDVACPE